LGSCSWLGLVVGNSFGGAAIFQRLAGVERRRGRLRAHFLERRGLDDAHQHSRETSAIAFEPLHDLIDGLHVVVLEAAAQRVGQQLLRQAAVKVHAMFVGENVLQLADAVERFARDQSAQEASGRRQSGTAGAMSGSELLRIISHKTQINELNVIIKADVMGSVTSVTDSLKTLDTEEVAVRVVSSGVGVINENDIHLAASTGAIIYGFHTELPAHIKRLASRDKVSVRLFQVIYELIDDAKAELGRLLRPEIVEETLGELEVKGVFKVTKTQLVAGGEVIKGRLSLPALANIRRAKKNLAKDLEVVGLKKGPQDVKEADQGELCGVSFKTTQKIDVQEGDKISFYRRQTKIRSL